MPEMQRRPQGQRLGGGVGAVYRRANSPCQTRNDGLFLFCDWPVTPTLGRSLMYETRMRLQGVDTRSPIPGARSKDLRSFLRLKAWRRTPQDRPTGQCRWKVPVPAEPSALSHSLQ